MAHSGSTLETCRKPSSARAYQKLCSRANARSNFAASAGEHEISMCARPRPSSDPECECPCSSASCATPGAERKNTMSEHVAKHRMDLMASSFARKYQGLQSQGCANRIKSQSTQISMSPSNYKERETGCWMPKAKFWADGRQSGNYPETGF